MYIKFERQLSIEAFTDNFSTEKCSSFRLRLSFYFMGFLLEKKISCFIFFGSKKPFELVKIWYRLAVERLWSRIC